jgi:Fe-S-cluster containining protein
MAFSLIDSGKAEIVLAKAYLPTGNHCLFLEVKDEINRMGSCTEYENRPFICRAFGLSARSGKHQSIEVSICKTLRDKQAQLSLIPYSIDEVPQIDSWKKNLETIDPQLLLTERPINESIIFLLEKLLLWKQLAPLDFCANDSFSANS